MFINSNICGINVKSSSESLDQIIFTDSPNEGEKQRACSRGSENDWLVLRCAVQGAGNRASTMVLTHSQPGPVFCLLLGVWSGCAWPITEQLHEENHGIHLMWGILARQIPP